MKTAIMILITCLHTLPGLCGEKITYGHDATISIRGADFAEKKLKEAADIESTANALCEIIREHSADLLEIQIKEKPSHTGSSLRFNAQINANMEKYNKLTKELYGILDRFNFQKIDFKDTVKIDYAMNTGFIWEGYINGKSRNDENGNGNIITKIDTQKLGIISIVDSIKDNRKENTTYFCDIEGRIYLIPLTIFEMIWSKVYYVTISVSALDGTDKIISSISYDSPAFSIIHKKDLGVLCFAPFFCIEDRL